MYLKDTFKKFTITCSFVYLYILHSGIIISYFYILAAMCLFMTDQGLLVNITVDVCNYTKSMAF